MIPLIGARQDGEASGELYFRPATGECRAMIEVLSSDLPDPIGLGDGLVIFNPADRHID